MTQLEDLISELKAPESPHERAGMARFGINVDNVRNISIGTLRRLTRPMRHDYKL